MKKLLGGLLIFAVHHVFATYNERLFQGVNPAWAHISREQRVDIISQLLPENPMVFEVGAFDGTDSACLAKMWPQGTIVSFEANPNQFIKYQKQALSFPNMQGYNLAVNTYNGMADFYLCWGTGGNDPLFEGASSLLPSSEAQKIHYMGPVIQVPCVIFDDWCRDQHITRFDFMWLDLEGFELQFLKSSPEIFRSVQVIYTETNFFGFREGTTQYHDLHTFLESQGFTMIAHWYLEGVQGDAIFVRNELVQGLLYIFP